MTAVTSATSSTDSNIQNAQQSLAGDQTTFIKLLTAQLRNQDPLSPLDANQFTQQLVVMTGVQQQILTNQLMNQLIKSQSSIDPVNLIGKTVTASTPSAALQGGKANWAYSLDGAAKDVSVQVLDNLNRVVWQSTPGAPDGRRAHRLLGRQVPFRHPTAGRRNLHPPGHGEGRERRRRDLQRLSEGRGELGRPDRRPGPDQRGGRQGARQQHHVHRSGRVNRLSFPPTREIQKGRTQ